MKVYGDKNLKKVVKIGEIDWEEYNNKNSAVGFIKEHGLFGEYVSKMYDELEEDMLLDTSTEGVRVESVEYNGIKYWYGANSYDSTLNLKIYRAVGVYKELPDIYDDNMFHWKNNKKYGSKECTIEDGVFEFHCIYKADGNAVINVKYCACDNLHRNKVTMAMIEVEYATNSVILKGIKQWKREFQQSLKN